MICAINTLWNLRVLHILWFHCVGVLLYSHWHINFALRLLHWTASFLYFCAIFFTLSVHCANAYFVCTKWFTSMNLVMTYWCSLWANGTSACHACFIITVVFCLLLQTCWYFCQSFLCCLSSHFAMSQTFFPFFFATSSLYFFLFL